MCAVVCVYGGSSLCSTDVSAATIQSLGLTLCSTHAWPRFGVRSARSALSGAVGSPSHSVISKTQAVAIKASLASMALQPEDAATVALELSKMPWHTPAHCDFASAPLEASTSPGNDFATKRRRSSQDFRTLPVYFTPDIWGLLVSGGGATGKLDIILNFALSAGLRCPSEPTIKLLSSLWVLVSEAPESRALLGPEQKVAFLRHTKAQFDSMRKKSADPAKWLPVLPSNPCTLQAESPAIWGKLYAAAGSCPAPLPAGLLADLQAIDLSYGCRGSNKFHKQSPDASLQTSATSMAGNASNASNVERTMQVFMASQGRMLELILGGGSAAAKLPSCLRPEPLTLEPAPLRRATSLDGRIHFLPPAIADTPVARAVASAAPANTRSPALVDVPVECQDAPGLDDALAEPAGADGEGNVEGESSLADVNDMLDMLATRKRMKATHPETPKPKAKACAKAEGVASVTPAKSAGIGGKVKAKAKSKVAPKPKELVTPREKAASKAKATGKAGKHSEPPADKVTLGCSKCRNSARGCARCKDANFTGRRCST